MSLVRRWGLPALVLCMPVLALLSGASRAADEPPSSADSKAVDTQIRDTLREVINEGADMYNATGKYANMERDYAGCFHLYEGALIATRPMLGNHKDLQKAISDGLDTARATPQVERRAFVLRTVIDKIRDTLNPNPGGVTPPVVKETTVTGLVTKVDAGRLTLKEDSGKEKNYSVPADAVVMIDGKPGKLEDVKADSSVIVTSKGEVVAKVDAKAPPAPPPPPKETTFIGKAVAADKGGLTAKDDAGKEKHFSVSADARVTIDGKDGKVEDIKKDSDVVVTSKGEAVTKVAAVSPTPPPPPPPPPPVKETKAVGKVTKVEKDRLTLKDDEGKEKNFTVPATARLTIDGKEGKLIDVKADSSATVTVKGDEVTKVEVKAPAAPPPPPPPPPPEAKTLWDRLGGETNVAKVVDDFVNTASKDPKVNFYRDPLKTPSKEELSTLKKRLVEFVSVATGGPLKYEGKDMKTAHKGMNITNEEFDAAAKDLREALEKNGAKADDVKAVLAAVEGTRKDIVEEAKPAPADKDKPADKDNKVTPADKDKPAPPDKATTKDKAAPDDRKPSEGGHVSGKVTYKGKPASGHTIGLIGKNFKYMEVIGADGTYQIKDDVEPGVYGVFVGENLDKPNPTAVKLSAKYLDPEKSGLTIEIKKGEQTHDIDLTD